MNLPYWLLRLLPMWTYICPKCRKEIAKNAHECPHCGEKFPFPVRVPPRVLKDKKALEDYVHKHIFPKIATWQRSYLAQFFTEYFNDGFESGDFSAWTGYESGSATWEVTSSGNPHSGTYHAHYSSSTFGAYGMVKEQFSSPYPNPIHGRFYIKWLALPTSDGQYDWYNIVKKDDWGTVLILEILREGGVYKAKFEAGLLGDSSKYTLNPQPSIGNWYCVEFAIYFSASGWLKFWWNGHAEGSPDIYQTGDTSAGTGGREIRFGCYSQKHSTALEFYVDACKVADAYIGVEGGVETYTKTYTTDVLFKKLGITKTAAIDVAFKKPNIQIQRQVDTLFKKLDILKTFGADVDFLKKDVVKSFAVDARFGALVTYTISRQIDVLFEKLGVTKTFGVDAYFGEVGAIAYTKSFALDVVFAYKVRLPEIWLDEEGRIVLNVSRPYVWVGS